MIDDTSESHGEYEYRFTQWKETPLHSRVPHRSIYAALVPWPGSEGMRVAARNVRSTYPCLALDPERRRRIRCPSQGETRDRIRNTLDCMTRNRLDKNRKGRYSH